MKGFQISEEQAKAFAAALDVQTIREYVEANRQEFERFVEEEQKHKQLEVLPPKRRVSRKGAR